MSKTNIGLVEYAKAQIGNPYWFGTFGQIGNAKLWAEKAKQYPKYYSDKRKSIMKERGDEGKKVHDCLGLWKGYMMSKSATMPAEYNKEYDYSADGIFDEATEKGSIDTLPSDVIGLGLHKKGHFGVYIGNGREIEARGFDYGVLEDDVKNAGFTEWFKIPFIEYEEVKASEPVEQTLNDVTSDDDDLYIVVAGDTLSKLAEKWGTNVNAIAELNHIHNPDLIITGQKLKKPERLPVSETWLGIVSTQRDPLNVRSGKGTNYPVIKQLARGSMVELTGDVVDGWYKLSDGKGYVKAEFIKKM